jgi:rhodanese-related sulfurtransferase
MFTLFFTQYYQRRILVSILMLFSSALVAEQKPYAPENIKEVTIVSAEEVVELILARPDLVIIDSRKKTEYQKGHIEGAINMLNTQLKPEDLGRVSPDKSTEILFYCNGTRCLRSADSIKKAKSWGYNKLIWFRGGWKEWTDKRLPVVTD